MQVPVRTPSVVLVHRAPSEPRTAAAWIKSTVGGTRPVADAAAAAAGDAAQANFSPSCVDWVLYKAVQAHASH